MRTPAGGYRRKGPPGQWFSIVKGYGPAETISKIPVSLIERLEGRVEEGKTPGALPGRGERRDYGPRKQHRTLI